MEWDLNNLGGPRIAVRQGSTLTYLHADPLGSASLATRVTGTLVSPLRYLPYGETRPDFAAGAFPTDRRFTGQRAGRWLPPAGQAAQAPALRTATGATVVTRMLTYAYDPLGRLVGATYSSGEAYAYQYDAAGNRTALTETTPLSGTTVTTYTYDAANRLTVQARSDGRVYTYTWSARGQLLAESTQGYPVRTFTYDTAGRLTQATVFTLTTRFTYHGDGARVAVEVVGQGTTTYTLDYADGHRLLAETTPSGTVAYLFGLDCLGELRAGAWLYYLPDAAGLVRQGTDAQGAVTSAWRFDPDGAVTEGPEGPVSHLVCGGVYDWSTGLIYQGGRYFDPSLGLWLTLLPLAVISAGRGRRGKRRGEVWLAVVCLAVGMGGVLTACQICPPTPSLPSTPTCTPGRGPQTPSLTPGMGTTPIPTLPPYSIGYKPGKPGDYPTAPPGNDTATPIPTPTPSGNMAYLTFDDQPNGFTPDVLLKLQSYGNIKATFNIVGEHLDWAGAYMNDIINGGHSIGLHSMNHVVPWYSDPSYATPYDQLTELIERVVSYGARPQVWRAPGGEFESELPEPYNQSFYRYYWDINPMDELGSTIDAQTIYSTYQKEMASNADDSIIILLHGWHPDALDLIIPNLIERGYQFGTLPRPGDPIGPVIQD